MNTVTVVRGVPGQRPGEPAGWQLGVGLSRVTIAAPRRRVDLALPAQVPLAELLPTVLRHAGEALAEDGEEHGGWLLRRADGQSLETGRTLAAQQVRDGEVLHLVPFRTGWPEPDYDDLADAVAQGARQRAGAWGPDATRRFALAMVGLVVAAALWPVPGRPAAPVLLGAVCLALATALVVTGVVLSRAFGDAGAGAVVAALAMPTGFLGGVVLLGAARSTGPARRAGAGPAVPGAVGGILLPGASGATQLLAGAAALLTISVVSYLGVAAGGRLFVAGTVIAVWALGAGVAGLWLSGPRVAALVSASLVPLVVVFPLAALRLSRLPVPAVPRGPAEVASSTPPERARVFAAVARADELLTGGLIAAGVLHGAAALVLVTRGGSAGAVLVAVVAAANLLRARTFVTVRQRLPLLVGGAAGLAFLAVTVLSRSSSPVAVPVGMVGAFVVGGLLLAAGSAAGRRTPSPYLGRLAEIADVAMVLLVVPVTCAVLGSYAFVRGLAG
jgi:type VII secretion integral membrane protein EccD